MKNKELVKRLKEISKLRHSASDYYIRDFFNALDSIIHDLKGGEERDANLYRIWITIEEFDPETGEYRNLDDKALTPEGFKERGMAVSEAKRVLDSI